MPMTMEERLDHARAALRAYFKAKGEAAPDSPEDYQDTDASDLIADLLHLQKHLGFKDVESTLATACLHYEAEQEEGATDAFGSAAAKLGCNEVEMAERMSDGDIAELVQSLKDVLSRFRSCIAGGNGEIEGDREAIAQAEALLVKAKGQNGANPRIQKSAVGLAEKK